MEFSSSFLEVSMILTRYETADAFLARAQAMLEQQEAANNLILGISIRLRENPERIRTPPYLASVEDASGLAAAAIMTPPWRLILYSEHGGDPVPLRPILEDLVANGWLVPGVVGPSAPAKAFAVAWSAATGHPHRVSRHERVYELRAVSHPENASGKLRAAVAADLDLVSGWIRGFQQDIGGRILEDARETAELRIADRDIFLWDDGGPVSMAGRTRHSTNGIAVGPVYTPPRFRRRGYATACVAALSQRLLDAGWQFCALFTDLANPTSNSIYQKIGYRPVCDFDEYDFG
jgi:predicted GNAT family acetyltransferase